MDTLNWCGRKRKLEDNGESSGAPSKKMKTESKGKGKDNKNSEENMIRDQNKLMYQYRDLVETGLRKPQLLQVLKSNKQQQPDSFKEVSSIHQQ